MYIWLAFNIYKAFSIKPLSLIDLNLIKPVITDISIDEVLLASNKIIEGKHKGRYIVNM